MQIFDKTLKIIANSLGLIRKTDFKAYSIVPNATGSGVSIQNIEKYGIPKPGKISFLHLRQLADYDSLIRICITIIKKEVSQADWHIQVKKGINPTPLHEKAIQKIQDLFENVNSNGENMRSITDKVMEDLLVLDQGVCELVRDINGEIIEIHAVDGANFRPVYDLYGVLGKTENGINVAYKQVINNVPVASFAKDELMVVVQNPQTNIYKFGFGISPIESILLAVQTSLQADLRNAKLFEDSNMPPGILDLGNMGNEEARQFIAVWEATVTAHPDRMKFMWGGDKGNKKEFIPLATSNKDMQFIEYIDWLSRIKLAAFGLSSMDANITQDINRSCYDELTETLTEGGWKKWWEIDENEKIATYNPIKKRVEYHKPINRYLYDIDEDINYFKTAQIDIAVTNEHKMFVKEARQEEYIIKEVQDIKWERFKFLSNIYNIKEAKEKKYFILPKVEKKSWENTGMVDLKIPMDDWLEFLGYFISEGELAVKSMQKNKYHFTLAQNEGQDGEKFKNILKKLPFKYDYKTDKAGCIKFNVYGKQLCVWLLNNCGGYCNEKRIPREFFKLPKRQLKILYDALIVGDGSIDKRKNRNSGYYASTSSQLINEVQELAFLLGWRTKTRLSQAKIRNHEALYIMSFSKGGDGFTMPKQQWIKKRYKGKVYCFEVLNHLFVTRRNGCITIQGNTASAQKLNTQSRGIRSVKRLWSESITKEIIRDFAKFDPIFKDLEYAIDENDTLEEKKTQADIDKIYLEAGVTSGEEIRNREGMPKLSEISDYPLEPPISPEPVQSSPTTSETVNPTSTTKVKKGKYFPPLY